MKGRNNKKHAFLNVTFAIYLVLHNLILFQVNAINTVVKTMLEKITNEIGGLSHASIHVKHLL